ncbi:hypothetical protein Tco_1191297 [Tanacetum coccineum]
MAIKSLSSSTMILIFVFIIVLSHRMHPQSKAAPLSSRRAGVRLVNCIIHDDVEIKKNAFIIHSIVTIGWWSHVEGEGDPNAKLGLTNLGISLEAEAKLRVFDANIAKGNRKKLKAREQPWEHSSDFARASNFDPNANDTTINGQGGMPKPFLGDIKAPDEEYEEYLSHLFSDKCTDNPNELLKLLTLLQHGINVRATTHCIVERRFTKEFLGIRKQTDGHLMEAFVSSLQSGRFLKGLMDSLPSTLEDLIVMMDQDLRQIVYESDCILEFDGGVKRNRGSAGDGVVLHDIYESLQESSRLSHNIGSKSIVIGNEKVTDSKRGKGLVVRSKVANSFAFRELDVVTQNFKDANLIGEGGFESVFKGWLESRKV